ITGNNRLATQDHRTATALEREDFRARRGNAGHGPLSAELVCHQAELQRRGTTKNTTRLRRILDARQLHDDTVRALALHYRFTDTEFVDAIVQGGAVLVDGIILD